jgi:hypothetical protein
MKRNTLSFAVLGLMAFGAGFLLVAGPGDPGGKDNGKDDESSEILTKVTHRKKDDAAPVGGAGAEGKAGPAGQAPAGYGIQFHGGPVMTGGMNVYIIWYGTHSATTKANLITMVSNIGGTPYWNINSTYSNSAGTKVPNAVSFKKAVVDTGGLTSLSDTQIQNIVAAHLNNGDFPRDVNGIYLVLTGTNVTASSGFCTQYCGWHTHFSNGGVDVKYAFIGSVSRCPNSCAIQNPGPNGDLNTDGMASIIAHEMEEAVTDPDLNAWWQNSTGMENADKCAWTFGAVSGSGNAKYNMTFGGKNWMIQQNWANVAPNGSCKKSQ